MKMQPADAAERRAFIEEWSGLMSVIAPAGVGKTESIVRRIESMATGPSEVAAERLRRLVVVTFTRRAARETKRRVLACLGRKTSDARLRFALQEAYFGTIHGFALQLLTRHGHLLGLPGEIEQLDEGVLVDYWRRMRARSPEVEHLLAAMQASGLLRCLSASEILDEVPGVQPTQGVMRAPGGEDPVPDGVEVPRPMPKVDIGPILAFPAKGNGRKNIERSQRLASQWAAAWHSDAPYAPLPEMLGSTKGLVDAWEFAFGGLKRWCAELRTAYLQRLATLFARQRLADGRLTFDDLIKVAAELVNHPEAGRRIAEERRIVILDEAQDTDDVQFDLLMGVAGIGGAEGAVGDGEGAAAEGEGSAGRFCMVGDFQQAIYGSRADPAAYRRADARLREAGGRSVRLRVTFRCDEAIVRVVNGIFAPVFDGEAGQALHAPMEIRPNAGPGAVERWHLQAIEGDPTEKRNTDWLIRTEATLLAEALAVQGLPSGAKAWGEVAILCGKRIWCAAVEKALRTAQIPAQRVGSRARRGELAAYRWMGGLLRVLAEPWNAFEVAGVLRELWGVSDERLHRHCIREGHSLALTGVATDRMQALGELRRLVEGARGMSLSESVHWLIDQGGVVERLRALPPEATGDFRQDLEVIQALAWQAGRQRKTPAEFANEFVAGLELDAAAEEPLENAVQVCTLHKAKGLQWPVVMLPFYSAPNLPHKVGKKVDQPSGEEEEENGGREEDGGRRVRSAEEQQKEQARLLYVGMTRAQRRLIVVDDGELAGELSTSKRGAGWRARDWVEKSAEGIAVWEGLPVQNLGGSARQTEMVGLEEPVKPPVQWMRPVRWDGGMQRITPSQLAHDPVSESPDERRLTDVDDPTVTAGDGRAFAYGDWWHRSCEYAPWEAEIAVWRIYWETTVAHCPQPERGRQAVDRFLRSDCAEWLAARRDWMLRRELPVFAVEETPGRPDRCLDGIADLVGMAPDRREGFVLDWKTNRDTADLAEIYGAQIRAYIQILEQAVGCTFRGWIYATESGDLKEVAR